MQIQQSGGAITNQTLAAISLVSNSVFPTQGNQWFVAPRTGSDNNNSGATPYSPFKTVAQALSMATANQNDTIYLLAQGSTASNTTDYLSSVLTWNKNQVHLVGVNAGPMLGQRSRISNLATAAAMAPMVNVTADNCLFSNLEILQGTPGSGTTSICLQVTGQRNVFQNCQISGMADLTAVADVSGSRSLKLSGSENMFRGCYIGVDTVIRATMIEEVEISGGARNIFEDCIFSSFTSLSTFKAVAFATACDRFIRFKNCTFYTAITGSGVAPTGAIGGTTMNGQVQVVNPSVFGYALIATGGNTSIKVAGAAQNATTVQGIGASAAAS